MRWASGLRHHLTTVGSGGTTQDRAIDQLQSTGHTHRHNNDIKTNGCYSHYHNALGQMDTHNANPLQPK